MITEQKHTGNIKVEEYSLAAWLAEVETVIKQGYKFDFESNDTFPQAFGSMYTVVMVPSVSSDVVTEAPWAGLGDVDKALNILRKQNEPTSKVDGRKKK